MHQSELLVRCLRVVTRGGPATTRQFSCSPRTDAHLSYRLLVVGGGAGGCGAASKFAGKLGGKTEVAVIEPSSTHYYQPMWTLVGGDLKKLAQSGRPMEWCLPKKANWLKDSVVSFNPEENQVVTASGDVVSYEYLVIAMGLQLKYEMIKGLPEAFDTPGVGSNYSDKYVGKTQTALREFKGGNAVFTFPTGAIKCPGAPQKIMYIAEQTFRDAGIKANIQYFSSLPVIFGVKKYADALWEVVKSRNIDVHLRHNLVEVKSETKEAVFENLDTNEKIAVPYDFLHVTPPMAPPAPLADNKDLADALGFLDVNKETLQHTKYSNIFGLGDCTNVPSSKTAAAVAAQLGILRKNLTSAMEDKPLEAKNDGYTSCPLVTGKDKVILAEFDFQAPPQPLETFPVNQAKERWSMYQLKAHLMPSLYFHGMIKGWWEGPRLFRKMFHLGMK